MYSMPQHPLPTLLKAMLVNPEEKTCSCRLHLAEYCVSADFTLAHDRLVLLTLLSRLTRDDDTRDLMLLTELKFAFCNDKANKLMACVVKLRDNRGSIYKRI